MHLEPKQKLTLKWLLNSTIDISFCCHCVTQRLCFWSADVVINKKYSNCAANINTLLLKHKNKIIILGSCRLEEIFQIIESSWNLVLSSPPLQHVPKCYIYKSSKCRQGWRLSRFPGQPVPALGEGKHLPSTISQTFLFGEQTQENRLQMTPSGPVVHVFFKLG